MRLTKRQIRQSMEQKVDFLLEILKYQEPTEGSFGVMEDTVKSLRNQLNLLKTPDEIYKEKLARLTFIHPAEQETKNDV